MSLDIKTKNAPQGMEVDLVLEWFKDTYICSNRIDETSKNVLLL